MPTVLVLDYGYFTCQAIRVSRECLMVGVGLGGRWRRSVLRSAAGVSLVGVLVTSGAGLVGCSGNPKITKTFTPTATESHRTPTATAVAEYQPATETSPAKNVPVPKYPEAAKAKTKAGQKAFIEYWFKTYNYAFETGDTKPLEAVSSDDCEICSKTVRDVHLMWDIEKSWKVGTGSQVDVSKFWTKDNNGLTVVRFTVKDGGASFWSTSGKSKKLKESSGKVSRSQAWIGRTGGGWLFYDGGVLKLSESK